MLISMLEASRLRDRGSRHPPRRPSITASMLAKAAARQRSGPGVGRGFDGRGRSRQSRGRKRGHAWSSGDWHQARPPRRDGRDQAEHPSLACPEIRWRALSPSSISRARHTGTVGHAIPATGSRSPCARPFPTGKSRQTRICTRHLRRQRMAYMEAVKFPREGAGLAFLACSKPTALLNSARKSPRFEPGQMVAVPSYSDLN